jgi:DNA-binding PucR family transcriptional regulator
MAVVADVAEADRGIAALEQMLRARGVRSVAAVKGLQLVAVMRAPSDVGWPAEFGRELHSELGKDSAIGIGGIAANAQDLRRSFIEAQQACRLAHRRPARYTVHPEIGSHALLLALQDDHVLSTFHNTLLGPLVEHDARRHTELVRTLELFLESGCAYQSTAEALHVHVNTLRGRLGRIEELTGRSLSDMETRVDFFIALRSRGSTSSARGPGLG